VPLLSIACAPLAQTSENEHLAPKSVSVVILVSASDYGERQLSPWSLSIASM